eukprot:47423-Eustigmatos_ZCMA.PRE.1
MLPHSVVLRPYACGSHARAEEIRKSLLCPQVVLASHLTPMGGIGRPLSAAGPSLPGQMGNWKLSQPRTPPPGNGGWVAEEVRARVMRKAERSE